MAAKDYRLRLNEEDNLYRVRYFLNEEYWYYSFLARNDKAAVFIYNYFISQFKGASLFDKNGKNIVIEPWVAGVAPEVTFETIVDVFLGVISLAPGDGEVRYGFRDYMEGMKEYKLSKWVEKRVIEGYFSLNAAPFRTINECPYEVNLQTMQQQLDILVDHLAALGLYYDKIYFNGGVLEGWLEIDMKPAKIEKESKTSAAMTLSKLFAPPDLSVVN